MLTGRGAAVAQVRGAGVAVVRAGGATRLLRVRGACGSVTRAALRLIADVHGTTTDGRRRRESVPGTGHRRSVAGFGHVAGTRGRPTRGAARERRAGAKVACEVASLAGAGVARCVAADAVHAVSGRTLTGRRTAEPERSVVQPSVVDDSRAVQAAGDQDHVVTE